MGEKAETFVACVQVNIETCVGGKEDGDGVQQMAISDAYGVPVTEFAVRSIGHSFCLLSCLPSSSQ